jgi:hypothetical protein
MTCHEIEELLFSISIDCPASLLNAAFLSLAANCSTDHGRACAFNVATLRRPEAALGGARSPVTVKTTELPNRHTSCIIARTKRPR